MGNELFDVGPRREFLTIRASFWVTNTRFVRDVLILSMRSDPYMNQYLEENRAAALPPDSCSSRDDVNLFSRVLNPFND